MAVDGSGLNLIDFLLVFGLTTNNWNYHDNDTTFLKAIYLTSSDPHNNFMREAFSLRSQAQENKVTSRRSHS